jgi:hypothetical protein
MRLPLLAGLAAVMLLSACGSRLNPVNWFGPRERTERSVAAESGIPAAQADARLLVAEVTRVALDPMPGGVILRATGLPPTQGYWDAELVPQPVAEDGTLTFDFRVFPPVTREPASTARSREIEVATFISDVRLAQITGIVVQGESNSRAARR